jgi:hypothetical protein
MAPRKMVSSIPTDNNRIGRFRILLKELRLILLASVKSSRTRPISAMNSKNLILSLISNDTGEKNGTSIPAKVKIIGPVMILRPSSLDARLYKKINKIKIIARNIVTPSIRYHCL